MSSVKVELALLPVIAGVPGCIELCCWSSSVKAVTDAALSYHPADGSAATPRHAAWS